MNIQILPCKDFISFMEHYKNEAMAIDLEKEIPDVYRLIQERRTKLETTNFKSVKKEIKQIAKEAINDFESKIIRERKNIIGKNSFYSNHTPRVFILMKIYYEYLNIYENAKIKKPKDSKSKIPKDLVQPFSEIQNQKLFFYLSTNWNNSNNNKYGYIWNFLFENKMVSNYKAEYERVLIKYVSHNGSKLNYDKCTNKDKMEELKQLFKDFKELN